jgi:outer membrane protein insertion porin family
LLFTQLQYQSVAGPSALNGILASTITASLSQNTIDNPINATRGRSYFYSIAFTGGPIGGNVNTITNTGEFKYFHPVNHRRNAIGVRFLAAWTTGYGGKDVPPYSRFYMGGENDIRGFDIWGVSPIVFLPTTATVSVFNVDGTPRMQKQLINNTLTNAPVTMTIPSYQISFPGGDTNVVTNLEYRIPIVGPVTLAIFGDAGVDKLSLPNQLKLNPGRIDQLNSQFPQAGFNGRAYIAPGTQKMRASTGLELQVLMPVVNAPFRVYWAYNPSLFRGYLQPPIAADRSLFPNSITYQNALVSVGQAVPFFERRSTFRFTIGRTF